MRRSPNDPRQSQDQRLLVFMLLSTLIFVMFWRPAEPPVQQPDEGQQAEQAEGADRQAPEDGGGQDAPPAVADTAGDDPAEAANAPAAPIEEAPLADPELIAIGSAASDSPYRMLMTLSNEGAAIRRLSLSSDETHDLHDRGGYLGVEEAVNGPDGGVLLPVVGDGTPAAQAGLQAGDVLLGAGDVEFAHVAALHAWLRDTKPGRTYEIRVRRDGEEVQPIAARLTRAPLRVIRPEAENLLLHLKDLPEEYEYAPSLIVRIAKLNGQDAEAPDIAAANDRLAAAPWTIDQDASDADTAVFTMRLAKLGLEVVKRYRIHEVPADEIANDDYRGYHFEFDVEFRNLREEPQLVSYQLEGPNGLPIEGFWYANKIGRTESGSGAWGAVGLRDVIARYEGSRVLQMRCVKIAEGEIEPFGEGAPMAYIGVDAQYFSTMFIPQKESLGEVWFDRADADLATVKLGEGSRPTLNNPTFTITRRPVQLASAGEEGNARTDSFTVFAGPKRGELLAKYYPDDQEIYGLHGILYYGWFGPVAQVMLWILHGFYSIARNYGVAIFMLTVLVRVCMYPLSRKQALNMVKMQELKPEIDRIAEKHKNDVEKRTRAQQELFRKHKYNPMGGCLLMFLQLPVFIGLYRALAVDVELREASLFTHAIRFCSNLAAPDMAIDWSTIWPQWFNNGFLDSILGIFALGPYLNLLPIATIALFLMQQKMFMPPPTNEQAALQQKMMKYMMMVFGLMFFKVPSGLCLYFIASSLWGIGERKLLPHPTPNVEPATPAKTTAIERPPKKTATAADKAARAKKAQKKKRR